MTLYESNPISSDMDCLVVNTFGYINDPRSIEADPHFIDRDSNDHHIDAALFPVVDCCDETKAQHTTSDTDREKLGWDDYAVANTYGPYDGGAGESCNSDFIFQNSFE